VNEPGGIDWPFWVVASIITGLIVLAAMMFS